MNATLIASIFLALSFTSLAHAADSPPEVSAPIAANSVSVRKEVKYIMPPYYHGGASALGSVLGGGLGALLAKGVSDEASAIAAYIDQQHIDVGTIVRKEFEAALAGRPDYASRLVTTDNNSMDSATSIQLVLAVKYGLTKIGFGSGLKPYLWVEVRQLDDQQHEQWMVKDYVGGNSKLSKDMSFEQYFASPQVFTEAFTVAAKEVAPLLVQKLKTPAP